MIATFNDDGVYFNSLQSLTSVPANSGIVMTDLNTGKLVAVAPDSLSNIYTSDGSLTDDRTITSHGYGLIFTGDSGNTIELSSRDNTDNSFVHVYPDEMELSSSTGSQYGDIILNGMGLSLVYNNGTNSSGIYINDDMTVYDDINNRGIRYNADYSSNFVDRSLVDKAYVDNVVNNNLMTARNGLTETSGNLDLGGLLTKNTVIGSETNSYAFNVINKSNQMNFKVYSGVSTIYGFSSLNGLQPQVETGIMDGSNKTSLYLGRNSIKFTDSINNKGVVYDADYSANFVDRSLVDKAYVDNAISSNSLIASNGLTKVSDTIKLGGDITEYTSLNPTASNRINIASKDYVGPNYESINVDFYAGDQNNSPSISFNVDEQNQQYNISNLWLKDNLATLVYRNKYLNMQDSGLKLASNNELLLSAPADNVKLNNTPSGTNSFAVATVGYVNSHISSSLQDGDGDTKIQVEKNTNENKIRFDTAGSERMIVDKNGFVGIGTNNPEYQLALVGNSSLGDESGLNLAMYSNDDPSGLYFFRAKGDSSSPTALTSGTIIGRILAEGYGGAGDSRYSSGLQMEATEDWSASGHGSNISFFTTDNGSTTMSRKVIINHNGYVGIGTNSPNYQLSLLGDGSSFNKGSLELVTYADSGAPSGIYFHRGRGTESSPTAITSGLPMGGVMVGGYDGSSMVPYSAGFQMDATEDWSASGHGTRLLFSTTGNGTTGMTTRMAIDHNGNIGIGTTVPTHRLEVEGDGKFTQPLTIGAYTLPNTDGSNGQVLQTDGSGNVNWASVNTSTGVSSIWDSDHDTGVQVEESNDEDMIRLDTAGIQRLRINNNGLLSYGTETTDFDVAVFGTVHSRNIVRQEDSDMSGYAIATWGNNSSPSRIIASKARGTEGSEAAVQNGDSIAEFGTIAHDGTRYLSEGGLIIAVDGSVSTNNIPSRLEFLTNAGGGDLGSDVRMVLDHNGNLGIGTTSPIYKLDVAGNARFTHPITVGAYTLPAVDGSNGQILQTDGSGNVSWVDASGGSSYWSRSGTTLSPATNGDDVNLSSGSTLSIVDLDSGSLIFADSGGLVSSAHGLYWNKDSQALGIGVMDPMSSLEVAGGIQLTDGINFANSGAVISSPSTAIEVNTDIIPDTDNSHALGSSSNRWTEVYAVNGTINTSDIRLKKDIRNEPYGLREVMALNPIVFKWKDSSLGNKDKLGFSAQDLQKIIPEVVNEDPKTGRLGVYYSDLIPVLWNAVKEQQAEIDKISKNQLFGQVQVSANRNSIWVACPSVTSGSIITLTPNKLVLVAVAEKLEGKGFKIEIGEHSEELIIDWIINN